MEPVIQLPPHEERVAGAVPEESSTLDLFAPTHDAQNFPELRWVFIGGQGLRAGWSAAIFVWLTIFFIWTLSAPVRFLVHNVLHAKIGGFSPAEQGIGESISVVAIVVAAAIVALMEHRRILDYNLAGPRSFFHFLSGLAVGFMALSALVGGLAWGGWLRFGAPGLSGAGILRFAAEWGVVFLLVGLFEEGAFRGYLQFTLARGIDFWWALAGVGAICLDLALRARGGDVLGVYLIAVLGLIPCLLLHLRKASNAGFWQAAWVTSTFFGSIHTNNDGENWIGVFAAAAIGFVFCVSVRVTGSAWWAIGCHAAWDWAETFFYGTADSGIQPQGHFLSASPAGAVLWSGGADGPEGSLLVIPVILLLLGAVLLLYGRRRAVDVAVPVDAQVREGAS